MTPKVGGRDASAAAIHQSPVPSERRNPKARPQAIVPASSSGCGTASTISRSPSRRDSCMEPMERYTKRRFAVPQAIAPTSSSPDTSRAKSRVVRYALPPGRLAPQARSAVSKASQRPPTSTATNSPTPTSSARRRTTGFTRPGSARRASSRLRSGRRRAPTRWPLRSGAPAPAACSTRAAVPTLARR